MVCIIAKTALLLPNIADPKSADTGGQNWSRESRHFVLVNQPPWLLRSRKTPSWSIQMFYKNLSIALFLGFFAAACGGKDDAKKETPPLTDEEICQQLCAFTQTTCPGEMACDASLGFDEAACVTECMTEPPTEEDLNGYLDTGCQQYNALICNVSQVAAQVQAACTCPAFESCDGGLTCQPLTDVSFGACMSGAGAPPEGSATCTEAGEWACPELDSLCITFSAGATEGTCLTLCN